MFGCFCSHPQLHHSWKAHKEFATWNVGVDSNGFFHDATGHCQGLDHVKTCFATSILYYSQISGSWRGRHTEALAHVVERLTDEQSKPFLHSDTVKRWAILNLTSTELYTVTRSFAALLFNGIRMVKRQNGNGKRPWAVHLFQRASLSACATPTFSDLTTLQYGSSEAHYDTL